MAAIPDIAVAMAILFVQRSKANNKLDRKVFPALAKASKENKPPSQFVILVEMISKKILYPSFMFSKFSRKYLSASGSYSFCIAIDIAL